LTILFFIGRAVTGNDISSNTNDLRIAVTNAATPAPTNPWDIQLWNYDANWHRITTVLLVWWIACSCYVVIAESVRLSRISDRTHAVDLLDLAPYQPLVRQGLINTLLLIGGVSGDDQRYAKLAVRQPDAGAVCTVPLDSTDFAPSLAGQPALPMS
jgi:hypothetical protein